MDVRTAFAGARVGVVGTGAMAEAMVAGMLTMNLVEGSQVCCSHPREERRRLLTERYGVSTAVSNAAAAEGADVVLLAVKPQVLPAVMPELKGVLTADQLVVSVIAGASTHALGTGLDHPAIVRSMPNTPAQIGQGVTVWFATGAVTDAQK
ncbi:MAG: pyrroline-5-carboxylate reductase family protein, partial [Candidatus Dormibacteria bacterium]